MICKPHKLTVSPHRNTENTFKLRHYTMLWKIWAHFKFKGCHMSQESCDGGNNTDVFSTKEDIDHQAYYQLSVPKNLWCVGEALIAAFISGKTSSVLRSMPVLESLNSEGLHVSHNAWSLNWPVCRAFMNWEHFEHHETNNRTKKTEDR